MTEGEKSLDKELASSRSQSMIGTVVDGLTTKELRKMQRKTKKAQGTRKIQEMMKVMGMGEENPFKLDPFYFDKKTQKKRINHKVLNARKEMTEKIAAMKKAGGEHARMARDMEVNLMGSDEEVAKHKEKKEAKEKEKIQNDEEFARQKMKEEEEFLARGPPKGKRARKKYNRLMRERKQEDETFEKFTRWMEDKENDVVIEKGEESDGDDDEGSGSGGFV